MEYELDHKRDDNKPSGLIVPYEKISEEALKGLIDEFILREGTDYGANEISLEAKHTQIFKQLKSGRILVVFDPTVESCSIVRKEHAPAQKD